MYQPYPSAGQPADPAARPQPPASVVMAVRFMYAGAAVSAVSLVISLVTSGNLRSTLHQRDPKLTPSQLHSLEGFLIGTAVVTGIIGIALWIWMARMNKAGKSWARIVGTVLFGLDTLFLLAGLVQAGAAAGALISILTWLVGLGAVLFLWRRESTAYFNAGRVR